MRYFRNIGGFGCDTAFVRVQPDGESSLLFDKRPSEVREGFTLETCISNVDSGHWEELTRLECIEICPGALEWDNLVDRIKELEASEAQLRAKLGLIQERCDLYTDNLMGRLVNSETVVIDRILATEPDVLAVVDVDNVQRKYGKLEMTCTLPDDFFGEADKVIVLAEKGEL